MRKERYRVVLLGNRNGRFYCKDKLTGSRTSLKTTDRQEAELLVRHKNEATKNAYIIGGFSMNCGRAVYVPLLGVDVHNPRVDLPAFPTQAWQLTSGNLCYNFLLYIPLQNVFAMPG